MCEKITKLEGFVDLYRQTSELDKMKELFKGRLWDILSDAFYK